MSMGLQCFDEKGNSIFDSNTDLTLKMLGSFTTNRSDGSFTFEKPQNTTPVFFVTHVDTSGTTNLVNVFGYVAPYLSVNDNGTNAVISWHYAIADDAMMRDSINGCNINATVLYGIYIS